MDIDLSNLEGRIREQENQSTKLDKKIDNLIDDMHGGFKQISGYFGVLEQQVDEVKANLAEVKTEMAGMETRIHAEMATKQDIAEVRTEMAEMEKRIRAEMATKTDLAEMERHLRLDMFANTADMKERIAEIAKDMHGDIKGICGDIKELIAVIYPRRTSQ